MVQRSKHSFCPRCGYTFGGTGKTESNVCPKCGVNIAKWKKNSIFNSKGFYAVSIATVALIGLVTFLYFTNKGVANELRQIREPMPNIFNVGIDISATMNPDALEDFKNSLIVRLKNFIGESMVSYHISTFGDPGCGLASVKDAISAQSPKDPITFDWEIQKKIAVISVAKAVQTGNLAAPLTTPLYAYLEKVLPESIGSRLIIYSDLMNDDSDCMRQYAFPEQAFFQFGTNPQGQIVFIYPTPDLTTNSELNEKIMKKQENFIEKVQVLVSDGKLRAFFYHVPDDPKDRSSFMKSQLQNSIPATMFEVVLERATKMVSTIVSAVRG